MTAKNVSAGRSIGGDDQAKVVERGSGEFTLKVRMPYEGWPHVSFYPAEGGQSFGGVYFGTGDSVLKEWWGEKALPRRTQRAREDEVAAAAEDDDKKFASASDFVPKFVPRSDRKWQCRLDTVHQLLIAIVESDAGCRHLRSHSQRGGSETVLTARSKDIGERNVDLNRL